VKNLIVSLSGAATPIIFERRLKTIANGRYATIGCDGFSPSPRLFIMVTKF